MRPYSSGLMHGVSLLASCRNKKRIDDDDERDGYESTNEYLFEVTET